MLANKFLKLPHLSKLLLAPISNMDGFHARQMQAEQILNYLKEQIEALKHVAEQRKSHFEQEEIERVSKENESIRIGIRKLKTDLKFYETQNGVKQIPVPHDREMNQSKSSAIPVVESESKSEKIPVGTETQAPKQNPKKVPKEKKEKSSKPAKGANDDDKPIDVSRLLLKIGKIVDVMKHPDADSLYVEQVDLGEEKNRTIVSGLVKSVSIEEMKNRMAIFCCNLKPAKMRGVLSEGMIMCGVSPDKTEIIEVSPSAAVGDRVTCDGFTGDADAQLPPKKKIWEQVQPNLHINVNGKPCYKGSPFRIEGKDAEFHTPTVKNCMIR